MRAQGTFEADGARPVRPTRSERPEAPGLRANPGVPGNGALSSRSPTTSPPRTPTFQEAAPQPDPPPRHTTPPTPYPHHPPAARPGGAFSGHRCTHPPCRRHASPAGSRLDGRGTATHAHPATAVPAPDQQQGAGTATHQRYPRAQGPPGSRRPPPAAGGGPHAPGLPLAGEGRARGCPEATQALPSPPHPNRTPGTIEGGARPARNT